MRRKYWSVSGLAVKAQTLPTRFRFLSRGCVPRICSRSGINCSKHNKNKRLMCWLKVNILLRVGLSSTTRMRLRKARTKSSRTPSK